MSEVITSLLERVAHFLGVHEIAMRDDWSPRRADEEAAWAHQDAASLVASLLPAVARRGWDTAPLHHWAEMIDNWDRDGLRATWSDTRAYLLALADRDEVPPRPPRRKARDSPSIWNGCPSRWSCTSSTWRRTS